MEALQRFESLTAVQYETIPAELRFARRWICWKGERRAGKITKRPIAAKVNDSSSWLTFEVARARALADGCGIGFVLGDGFIGVDFDGCVSLDGELHPAVIKAVTALQSYAELSPSGTGVHILARGAIRRSCRRPASVTLPARELYDGSEGSGRFFTMTGRRLPIAPASLASGDAAQTVLDEIERELFGDRDAPSIASPLASELSDERVLELLTNAKNGKKAARLLAGDVSDYESPSNADLALCRQLRFYTRDSQQIDRIFRGSGLMRNKWDELHGAESYGAMTIRRALAGGGPVYVPREAYKGDEKANRLLRERTSYARGLPLWWVVRLHGIGELGLRILWVIASYENEGQAWPSIETIAFHCRVTEGRVKETLAILNAAGVYSKGKKRVLRRSDGKPTMANVYRLISEAPDVLEPSTPYDQLRAARSSTRGTGFRPTRGTGNQYPKITIEDNHILDTEGQAAKNVTKSVTRKIVRGVEKARGNSK